MGWGEGSGNCPIIDKSLFFILSYLSGTTYSTSTIGMVSAIICAKILWLQKLHTSHSKTKIVPRNFTQIHHGGIRDSTKFHSTNFRRVFPRKISQYVFLLKFYVLSVISSQIQNYTAKFHNSFSILFAKNIFRGLPSRK